MSRSLIHPQHDFVEEGFESDEYIDDSTSELSQGEPLRSGNEGDSHRIVPEVVDDQFDDEIVGDD